MAVSTVGLEKLFSDTEISSQTKIFRPTARYYPAMDDLIYIQEDCSYVADRVSTVLTVLWHPHEKRLVGVKLKGFKWLFNQLKSFVPLDGNEFLPLVTAVRLAFVNGMGEVWVNKLQQERLERLCGKAIELSKDINVPPEEWRKAA